MLLKSPKNVMGLMRYKRLNFGISSAPKIFHNVIQDTLEGVDGVKNISDNILVFGKSQKEHDQHPRAVFQRLREKGLTLNKSKCEFSKDKLEFFGYMSLIEGISPDPKKNYCYYLKNYPKITVQD